MKKLLCLSLTSASFLALAQGRPSFALAPVMSALSSTPAEDGAYAAGTRAMNEQRWPDAIRNFDTVIAARGTRHADAALYWKAYSLSKLSRKSDATASCDLLHVQFPDSSWNNDCRTLSLNVQVDLRDLTIQAPAPPEPPSGSLGGVPGGRGSDADLKLLALNSLVNQDPARAMPILRGMLDGNQPLEVKKHAIFVLTQSKSPEAESILHDAVIGKMGPPLQRQAIQMMGVFEGKRANDTLEEVYRTTPDVQVKRAVISAFFISHDAPRMVDLARSEKDLELKRTIVSQLALMNDKAATDYMLELLK